MSRGGNAQPIELCDHDRRLAIRAAATVGADYAGVDVLHSREGRAYVIEVNGVPGWKALSRVTGCDVARAVVQSLESLRK